MTLDVAFGLLNYTTRMLYLTDSILETTLFVILPATIQTPPEEVTLNYFQTQTPMCVDFNSHWGMGTASHFFTNTHLGKQDLCTNFAQKQTSLLQTSKAILKTFCLDMRRRKSNFVTFFCTRNGTILYQTLKHTSAAVPWVVITTS